MATDKQIAANRLNALKSTGPRTEAGWMASRRNSLIHGLSGAGMVLPEHFERMALDRAGTLNSSLKPMTSLELWLNTAIGRDALRVEDCVIRQQMRKCELVLRAQTLWDDDRREDARQLADGLGRRPEHVASALRGTKHGCELLAERWAMLARGLEVNGGWNADQRSYALDLLGTPPRLRDLPAPFDPPAGADPLEHRKAFARDEAERLKRRAEGALAAADSRSRYAAEIGATDDDPELRRLRRYESECLRRIGRLKGLFHQTRPGGAFEKLDTGGSRPWVDPEARRGVEAARRLGARQVLPEPEETEIPWCVPEPTAEELSREVEEEKGPAAAAPESAPPAADDFRATG